ncbi:TrmB family transcriptional regulator [Methanobacterium congolense]|uniref:HTH-type sugar sensing transcriptional regulator TrmBL1 n=1 Tax=Methanobacterium congolense TaxID=118062 RepID=A0A1D3L0Z1_9EURY|nr:helix-turn-helix domain-containing protein [Methanobacterium congolense]SCG85159.1 HTH-type sugar sensing transcriptional regulator TrmBL1 [Methanobacterium congolense]
MADIPVENETLNALKTMGLTDYETRAYVALTSVISGTATELSEASNVPRSKIYVVLKSLVKKGFVEMSRGKPLQFTVVPPHEVFKRSRNEIMETMDKAEAELNVVYETQIPNVPAPIWLVHGPEKIVNKELEIISRAEESLIIMAGFMFKEEPSKLKELIKPVIKKGVDVRIITVPHSVVDDDVIHVSPVLENVGCDLKVLQIPNIKMVLRDKKEMLVAFSKFSGESAVSKTSIGIWNQYKEFVETIGGIYEFVWSTELFKEAQI